jgi:predicted dehydrogenase
MNSNKDKIRVGVVGVGNWGRYGHVPVLQLLPNFEIVAFASRRKEYAESIARQFDIPYTFTDANELICHPDVDLVVVLPPAPQHATFVRAAITAGKDIYCEWPLTTNIADTEDLLTRAEAAGVRHIVGLQRRMGPSARFARDLLVQGYVGQVRSVRMHVSFQNPEDNIVEGSQGDGEALSVLPIPVTYQGLPASNLDASVLDLAYLYSAYADDREKGTRNAPTFNDAVRMHKLIDVISEAASTGTQKSVNFW